MSRLTFKEDNYFESDNGHNSDNSMDSDNVSVRKRRKESKSEEGASNERSDSDILNSSYALYGIERAHLDSGRPGDLPSTIRAASQSIQQALESSNVVEETLPGVTPKSSRKKRKKRKLDDSKQEIVGDDDDGGSDKPAAAPVTTSAFLSKFLKQKRDLQNIPEPPEIEPANDSFLRLFNSTLPRDNTIPPEVDELELEDRAAANTNKNEGQASAVPSEARDETFALQLFNLPYKITPEQLQAFGAVHGFTFTSVTMGVDWKTKLPSGSATVHVLSSHTRGKKSSEDGQKDEGTLYGDPENEEVGECIQALQGEEIGGRPLRVQRYLAKKRQSGSLGGRGDSRYFNDDISCKCHNCGQVGHKQQDCTNESMPVPCHLCAGLDHDAGGCPNITCYRCGKFGHHSRDCTFPSMARPVICTNCGSNRHDIRGCRDTSRHFKPGFVIPESKVAGPMVRCMSCNTYGHVMCQPLPAIPAVTAEHIYCPNCGENGHHIDFPQLYCALTSSKKRKKSGTQNECMEPKYDAFIKFPQLLNQVDQIPLVDRVDYFRQISHRSSHSDQMLFPPLARQLAPFHNNHSNGGGGTKGRHSLGGGDAGRSVVRYQDGVQRMHQRFDQQNNRGESERMSSALQEVTSGRWGVGEDNDFEEGRSSSSGGGKKARYSNGSSGNPGAGRRHSYPLNGPQRQREYEGGRQGQGAHSSGRWDQSHSSQHTQHQQHSSRHSSVLDPALRGESRKRRFNH